MENQADYKIPLAELLAMLKSNGYEVSIERILETQSLLLSTPLTKLRLSELKFLITPLIARNDDDQENIYKLIDAFIAASRRPVKKTPSTARWITNRHVLLGLKLAGFLIVITTAVLLYFFQQKSGKPKQQITSLQPILPVDTLVKKKSPVDDTSRPKSATKRDVQPITTTVEYNGKGIAANQIDIIVQIAGAFGFGLGAILYYFIFFEKKKRMETKKKIAGQEKGFTESKAPGQNPLQQQVYATLRFPEKDFLIQKTKDFSVLRSNLKKAALTDSKNLHVRETVLATTKNAGFPSPVFDDQWKERKYLVLVNKKPGDAHLNHLFDFVTNFFSSSKIVLTKRVFTSGIDGLNDVSGQPLTLEDLRYDFPGYHLIIIGDCRSFFLAADQSWQKNIEEFFRPWPSRSIITPLPLADWSWIEEGLRSSSFNIVPAEIAAIELLTKAIAEDSAIASRMLESRVRDHYSLLKYDFKTANEVRSYLDNEELFQVFCSLAVYPRLDWNITLALFTAIVKSNPAYTIKPEYDALLKLARIPWLNNDRLDESLRLQLFNFLKPETEIIARETILELLKEIDPFVPAQSPAYQEMTAQVKINSFFLYAHDPQQYKQYKDVNNEILDFWNNTKEWSLKERSQTGLMPVSNKGVHETVEEFVLQEKQFEKSNKNLLRAALLLLPAAMLYILLSAFRPPIVYLDAYDKVSFVAIVQNDTTCNKLTQVIIQKPQKFDTLTAKEDDVIRYIPVNGVEYNRPVRFFFLFRDSSATEQMVEARDSVAVVKITCR